MEFEVFALNDGCYFEEGFCQTSHALGPFCLTQWEPLQHSPKKRPVPPEMMKKHLDNLHTYLWYQNNCGSSHQQDGLPNGPCSLCSFGRFRDWSVHAVKIVGREASFYRKMRSLQLVKAVMDEVRGGSSVESIAELAKSLRRTPEYCETGYMCYFRE
jgi:putative protease